MLAKDQNKKNDQKLMTDSPVLDLNNSAIKSLIKKGKVNGFVTLDELNAALNNISLLSTHLLDVSLARNAPGPGHSKSDFNSPLLFVCGTERPSLPPIIIPRSRVSRT